MIKKFKSYVREQDIIAPEPISQLHFDDNLKQTTFCGGIMSIALQCYFIYIVLTNGYNLLWKTQPYTETKEADYENEGKIYFNDTVPLMLSFQDYSFKSETIDKSKLHLYTTVYTKYKADNGT